VLIRESQTSTTVSALLKLKSSAKFRPVSEEHLIRAFASSEEQSKVGMESVQSKQSGLVWHVVVPFVNKQTNKK
jgi:hypothetical protein